MHPRVLQGISDADVVVMCATLKEMYHVEVTDFLIYQHENYCPYFERLFKTSKNDYLFAIKNCEQIAAFAHFRTIGTEIFLNNIACLPDFRGKGFAKQLLKYGISNLLSNGNYDRFSLDVFERNSVALDWYKSMGMLKVSETNWYDASEILYYKHNYVPGNNVLQDANGFTGLYSGKEKIATAIKSALVFREARFLTKISSAAASEFTKACLVSAQSASFPLLDKSFRMTINTSKLKYD